MPATVTAAGLQKGDSTRNVRHPGTGFYDRPTLQMTIMMMMMMTIQTKFLNKNILQHFLPHSSVKT
jgi:hypothetical protein